MKGNISPAVIVVVVVVLLAVVGAVGFKMFGGGKAKDNIDPAMMQQYRQGMSDPSAKAAEEMKHMKSGGGPGGR